MATETNGDGVESDSSRGGVTAEADTCIDMRCDLNGNDRAASKRRDEKQSRSCAASPIDAGWFGGLARPEFDADSGPVGSNPASRLVVDAWCPGSSDAVMASCSFGDRDANDAPVTVAGVGVTRPLCAGGEAKPALLVPLETLPYSTPPIEQRLKRI